MRIGIIGAGMVGGALGKRWAGLGHQVLFGVRDPAAPKVKQLLADAGPNACAGSIAEAAAFGPVVVLAVPWGAAHDAIQAAGDFSGKIVIDPTSPVKRDLSGLDVPEGSSAAEQVAAWAPGARVVKAFNTVSHTAMTDPRFRTGTPRSSTPATMTRPSASSRSWPLTLASRLRSAGPWQTRGYSKRLASSACTCRPTLLRASPEWRCGSSAARRADRWQDARRIGSIVAPDLSRMPARSVGLPRVKAWPRRRFGRSARCRLPSRHRSPGRASPP